MLQELVRLILRDHYAHDFLLTPGRVSPLVSHLNNRGRVNDAGAPSDVDLFLVRQKAPVGGNDDTPLSAPGEFSRDSRDNVEPAIELLYGHSVIGFAWLFQLSADFDFEASSVLDPNWMGQ